MVPAVCLGMCPDWTEQGEPLAEAQDSREGRDLPRERVATLELGPHPSLPACQGPHPSTSQRHALISPACSFSVLPMKRQAHLDSLLSLED